MTKLRIFSILFPVDYLKEVLVPEKNKLLKHPIDPEEFIRWLVCWFYICRGQGLKVYFFHYIKQIERMLNIMMGSSRSMETQHI